MSQANVRARRAQLPLTQFPVQADAARWRGRVASEAMSLSLAERGALGLLFCAFTVSLLYAGSSTTAGDDVLRSAGLARPPRPSFSPLPLYAPVGASPFAPPP